MKYLLGLLALIGFPAIALASEAATTGHVDYALVFLWIAIILIFAKGASVIERIGMPAVLGEILIGAILGNLFLLDVHGFEAIKASPIIGFLAELGVVILLFQIGLESNLQAMRKVGFRALAVALTGVIATFTLGYFLIPFLVDLSPMARIFLAGAFTSTSVGIGARVFRDFGKLKTEEAQLVLGAAILDDVIGLVILAVLSSMVSGGEVTPLQVGTILAKAVGFLAAAVLLGQLVAPRIGRLFSKLHDGIGMKLTLALSFGLIFAYLAKQLDLAPIIGAFAAGLVLDAVHFRNFKDPAIVSELRELSAELSPSTKEKLSNLVRRHADRHIEEIIEPLGIILIPIFFVLTGMNVSFEALSNPAILLSSLGLAAIAIAGKVTAGLAAGPVRKWVVGWGMVPRGEVQLIFAAIGKSLGILTPEIFSMVVVVVIVTTILTPIVLSFLLKDAKK